MFLWHDHIKKEVLLLKLCLDRLPQLLQDAPPPCIPPAFLPNVFIPQLPRDVFRLAFPVGLNDLQSSLLLPNSVDLTLESGFLSLAAWMSDYQGDGSSETAGGGTGVLSS